MKYIVETKDLTKIYGGKAAVDKMSVHIERGDIYGLIGKNGAGKTTFLRMLLGLSMPTSGEISLFDGEPLFSARRKIGALIEAPALYKGECAYENMKRFAILSPTSDEKIHELLRLVGLGDVGKKKVGAFSLGMKQRLGIAVALLGEPELLILDEPVNGLDPEGIRDVRNIILDLNSKGVSFIISSHLLDELGKIATRYGIMSHGVLTEEISSEKLTLICSDFLKIETDDGSRAIAVLKESFGDIKAECAQNTVTIQSGEYDSSSINRALVLGGVKVYELGAHSVGVEDFFIERMGV